MFYTHDSLYPENQDKLIISVAPYGPEWMPSDFPEDIPISMDEQVQKAVDCYNAGATVLHVHVREADGKGSKRMSMFNELLYRLREAVPKMILQVGGSISFAPEPGNPAQWPANDSRHALALLETKPDQVTIAINTSQMNILELLGPRDVEGTSLSDPGMQAAFRDMYLEAGPSFYETNLRMLCENGIQPNFMLAHVHQLETVELIVRKGLYKGPLNLCYVAIGGGMAGRHPTDLVEFARRVPDGAVLTNESIMRTVYPTNAIAIAMGHHVRVGIEDTLWGPRYEKMTSVQQIEWCVDMAKRMGRDIASADEARASMKIGQWYETADETLKALGWAPNRKPGQRGNLMWG
ncbi:3-keto-5-aminohexanoate cleavage protein [Pseudomonas fluorescens]|uniref:3-keto-5-aminohexanoate cleavage protein n=1 Tax=Pseudomonas fluorescens TaxID=294 RepID=UPI001241AB23|nr:3-keto-5-aminohexanoate cleavage protein [Pseudomonas fluorescens]VVM78246.1 3-keto-5-aminohexanoate cleavage enzyme [Pseudomonas fluorescens]